MAYFHYALQRILALFLSFLLIGCVAVPSEQPIVENSQNNPTCDEIAYAKLHSLPFHQGNMEDVKKWLSKEFGSESLDAWPSESTSISVKHETLTFDFEFAEQSLVRVSVRWNKDQYPSGDMIIKCFGTPDLYQAYVPIDTVRALRVDLWYLDAGMVVHSYQQLRATNKVIPDGEMPFQSMWMVQPGDPIEMLRSSRSSSNRISLPEETLTSIINSLEPWSGSFESMEVIDCYIPGTDCHH